LDERITTHELWSLVYEIVTDPDDRLLVYARFVLDLKPAEIRAMYPLRWATARDVSVALQRIRRGLRNNDDLRRLVNLPDM
jgi:hypothetical protein